MFRYNKDTGFLEVSKYPLPKVSTVYQDSPMYTSFMKYIKDKTGLLADIKEFIARMNDVLSESCGSCVTLHSYRVRKDCVDNQMQYSVFVKLWFSSTGEETPEFCIFKLPYMDRFGKLEYSGNEYCLISTLVQDATISYDIKSDGTKKQLKLILDNGFNLLFSTMSSKGFVLEFKSQYKKVNIDILGLLCGLLYEQGKDYNFIVDPHVYLRGYDNVDKLAIHDITIDEYGDTVYYNTIFRNSYFCNFVKVSELPAMVLEHQRLISEYKLFEVLSSDKYSLSSIRPQLNEMLSLNRAIGCSLSRDIICGEYEFIYGTIVSEEMLRVLKRYKINTIFVQDVPDKIGYYLAESVRLPMLMRGTKLPDELKEELGVASTYLPYDVKAGVTVHKNTVVTEELLDTFSYNGISCIKIKKTASSSVFEYCYFEREIVGNSHYMKCDIEDTNSKEWVYVSDDGEILPMQENLTHWDVIAIISLFSNFVIGKDMECISNVDMGLRKRVDLTAELFSRSFRRCLKSYVKKMANTFRKLITTPNGRKTLVDEEMLENKFFGLTAEWWKDLYKSKVVVAIDYMNPIATASSMTKCNTILAKKKAVSDGIRMLSMGHYGRLCPYESPQSYNLGTVNNLAKVCKIIDGKMYTPYHKVIHENGVNSVDLSSYEYLSVEEEEHFIIASIMSLDIDDNGIIKTNGKVICRVPTNDAVEKMEVMNVAICYIDYISVYSSQTLGYAASSVVCASHNDAVRLVFGVSMVKQTKGQVYREIPRVIAHGIRDIIMCNTYYQIVAEYDGLVLCAEAGLIAVMYDGQSSPTTYEFETIQYTTVSVIIRKVECKEYQRVKAGDVLMSSNYTKDGMMCQSINVLVGYVPTGYNYEDSAYVSARLEQRSVSFGVTKQEEPIPRNMSATIDYYDKFKYINRTSTAYKLKMYVGDNYRVHVVKSERLKGFLLKVTKEYDNLTKRLKSINAYCLALDSTNSGDKYANCHGNKGVASRTTPNSEMPQFLNGEFLDLAYNPCGTISRMIIGQIQEGRVGFALHVLDLHAEVDPFDGFSQEEANYMIRYAYHMANDDDLDKVIQEFDKIPIEIHNQVISHIDKVRIWKGCFDEKGKAIMINPRTGKQFANPIDVMCISLDKLMHEGDKKLHSRGGYITSEYVEKTAAPTKGSKKGGGQRMGTMEFDAYLAYGAKNLLWELYNIRGDNPVIRNNYTVSQIHTGTEYKCNEDFAIRRSTQYFIAILQSLGLSVDFDGLLPNDLPTVNAQREYYDPQVLTCAVNTNEEDESEKKSAMDYVNELDL